MGDSSPEYDPDYARFAAEVRAELKELAKDTHIFSSSSSYDPADRGWSTYVTDANAFFAGRRIKPTAWRVHYDRGLCSRLALYCYNLQNGTAYDFQVIIQIHEQHHLSFTKSFITFEAVNPADGSPLTFETCVKHIDDRVTHVPNLWWETHICRVEGSEEADYEWNDGAVHDYYKGEMPKWLSNEDQQRCYKVEQSELRDKKNGWLTLLTEFAFFTKWNGPLSPAEIEDCRPLITQHVVVETLDGEGEKEPRDKLNAANAIFYISFECVEDPTIGRYRAVVRKTMDGKPGHMRLEVTCSRV
ncbi:UPF0725 protein [Raphanus sativus]|uniref:UPF0725 protein At4g29550-like n=1 Tax=Raphanus sativus TaxID=3726 RepID=A0A9W3D6C2_RAPSA|nr:UPF0725 protein At4g29550-like [Raphanus sativus]KAJ4913565.1 UPF0725 protein [Raphanus sativus]